uniref:Uncharacterized protein n=1 Tax=Ixodes ricinus TaxID=34613 RepID=A0A6B0UPQ2_IXORI
MTRSLPLSSYVYICRRQGVRIELITLKRKPVLLQRYRKSGWMTSRNQMHSAVIKMSSSDRLLAAKVESNPHRKRISQGVLEGSSLRAHVVIKSVASSCSCASFLVLPATALAYQRQGQFRPGKFSE